MKTLLSFSLSILVILQMSFAPAHDHLEASPVQGRDSWRSVRTNNLFVIGNTDAESLRQVAAWLEFFHGAFARLGTRSAINSSVPTTVVVFRDEASFLPFKPLYQGKPANLAGYFQPGDDLNYIAISLNPNERDPYGTAFHEYVHLNMRDNFPSVPLWLNEGLAEFYSSMQFAGGEAMVGGPIPAYIQLLRGKEMLPLKTLFSVGSNSPHYNEQDQSGIFYGESWILVHYLMQGAGGRHRNQFKRFLELVSRGDNAERTFEEVFGMTLATAEQELRDYVRRGEIVAQRVAIGESAADYTSYTAMQRSSLSEGEANYYLGDLLLHINRQNDAERYFLQAISLEPDYAPPYAALGLLRVRQRRYAEARKYLQKAIATPQSYQIHYLYAYTLSREGIGSNGEINGYQRENVVIMREQLLRSIKLAPQFVPAYHLLALVDLVADEQLSEAETMAEKAHQLAPSKASYSMLLAEIYVRRSNTNAARQILEELTKDRVEPAVRIEAQNLLDNLERITAGSSPARSNHDSARIKLSDTLLTEPIQPTTSRMIAGAGSSSDAIRDGQTIDNSGPLPTVDEILDRFVQALGGEAAIKAVTSRVTKGTLDVIGVSRNGSFEIYAVAPNMALSVMQAYSMGTVKVGFNGQVGWVQAANKLRIVKALEMEALRRDSDFYQPVRLKNNFTKITLLGKSKIGYREVYVLELQPNSGANEKLWLDAESYLPVRFNGFRTNGPQTALADVYFDDWRAADGIQFPFTITQSFPGLTMVFKTTEIRHNVAIERKPFEAPTK
jgi:tetratricopeptide (TPR) repeat protein